MATPAIISANIPCNQMVILMNDFTIQSNMLQQITKKKEKEIIYGQEKVNLLKMETSRILYFLSQCYIPRLYRIVYCNQKTDNSMQFR